MGKRTIQRMAKRERRPQPAAPINLAVVRQRRKQDLAEHRLRDVLDETRAALGRLFTTGLIFTQQGSRAGRELLSTHQTLQRVADLFARLREDERGGDLVLKARVEEAYGQLDDQLRRSLELTARTVEFLAGRGRE